MCFAPALGAYFQPKQNRCFPSGSKSSGRAMRRSQRAKMEILSALRYVAGESQ